MSFKPSTNDLCEDVERFFKEKRATGVWVWEKRKENNKIVRWTCRVEYGGGRLGYVDMAACGGADPVLFKKARKAMIIHVRGSIIAVDRAACVAPSEHFTPSVTMRRCPDLEGGSIEPVINDELRGEYRLDYHEVWLCTDETPPTATHSGSHNLLSSSSPPTDGSMA
jgi:hypothetical protein